MDPNRVRWPDNTHSRFPSQRNWGSAQNVAHPMVPLFHGGQRSWHQLPSLHFDRTRDTSSFNRRDYEQFQNYNPYSQNHIPPLVGIPIPVQLNTVASSRQQYSGARNTNIPSLVSIPIPVQLNTAALSRQQYCGARNIHHQLPRENPENNSRVGFGEDSYRNSYNNNNNLLPRKGNVNKDYRRRKGVDNRRQGRQAGSSAQNVINTPEGKNSRPKLYPVPKCCERNSSADRGKSEVGKSRRIVSKRRPGQSGTNNNNNTDKNPQVEKKNNFRQKHVTESSQEGEQYSVGNEKKGRTEQEKGLVKDRKSSSCNKETKVISKDPQYKRRTIGTEAFGNDNKPIGGNSEGSELIEIPSESIEDSFKHVTSTVDKSIERYSQENRITIHKPEKVEASKVQESVADTTDPFVENSDCSQTITEENTCDISDKSLEKDTLNISEKKIETEIDIKGTSINETVRLSIEDSTNVAEVGLANTSGVTKAVRRIGQGRPIADTERNQLGTEKKFIASDSCITDTESTDRTARPPLNNDQILTSLRNLKVDVSQFKGPDVTEATEEKYKLRFEPKEALSTTVKTKIKGYSNKLQGNGNSKDNKMDTDDDEILIVGETKAPEVLFVSHEPGTGSKSMGDNRRNSNSAASDNRKLSDVVVITDDEMPGPRKKRSTSAPKDPDVIIVDEYCTDNKKKERLKMEDFDFLLDISDDESKDSKQGKQQKMNTNLCKPSSQSSQAINPSTLLSEESDDELPNLIGVSDTQSSRQKEKVPSRRQSNASGRSGTDLIEVIDLDTDTNDLGECAQMGNDDFISLLDDYLTDQKPEAQDPKTNTGTDRRTLMRKNTGQKVADIPPAAVSDNDQNIEKGPKTGERPASLFNETCSNNVCIAENHHQDAVGTTVNINDFEQPEQPIPFNTIHENSVATVSKEKQDSFKHPEGPITIDDSFMPDEPIDSFEQPKQTMADNNSCSKPDKDYKATGNEENQDSFEPAEEPITIDDGHLPNEPFHGIEQSGQPIIEDNCSRVNEEVVAAVIKENKNSFEHSEESITIDDGHMVSEQVDGFELPGQPMSEDNSSKPNEDSTASRNTENQDSFESAEEPITIDDGHFPNEPYHGIEQSEQPILEDNCSRVNKESVATMIKENKNSFEHSEESITVNDGHMANEQVDGFEPPGQPMSEDNSSIPNEDSTATGNEENQDSFEHAEEPITVDDNHMPHNHFGGFEQQEDNFRRIHGDSSATVIKENKDSFEHPPEEPISIDNDHMPPDCIDDFDQQDDNYNRTNDDFAATVNKETPDCFKQPISIENSYMPQEKATEYGETPHTSEVGTSDLDQLTAKCSAIEVAPSSNEMDLCENDGLDVPEDSLSSGGEAEGSQSEESSQPAALIEDDPMEDIPMGQLSPRSGGNSPVPFSLKSADTDILNETQERARAISSDEEETQGLAEETDYRTEEKMSSDDVYFVQDNFLDDGHRSALVLSDDSSDDDLFGVDSVFSNLKTLSVRAAPSTPTKMLSCPAHSGATPEGSEGEEEEGDETASTNIASPVQMDTGDTTTVTASHINLDSLLRDKLRRDQEKEDGKRIDYLKANPYEENSQVEESDDEDGDVDLMEEHKVKLDKLKVEDNVIMDQHPGEIVFDDSRFRHLFDESISPAECGFVAVDGSTDMWENKVNTLPQEVLTELLRLGVFNHSSFTNPGPFYTWILHVLSVHSNDIVIDKCEKLLYHYMGCNKAPDWIPSLTDICRIFVNYGFACETIHPKLTINELRLQGGSSQNMENVPRGNRCYGFRNMQAIIRVLTTIVKHRHPLFNSEDLVELILIIIKVSLDRRLYTNVLRSDFHTLISVIVEVIPDDKWETALACLCSSLPRLVAHHHNMVYVCEMFSHTTRGRAVQRRVALNALQILLGLRQPEWTNTQTTVKLSEVLQTVNSLVLKNNNDYYRISSQISLLELSVGNEGLKSHEREDLDTLNQVVRNLTGDIRDSVGILDRTIIKDKVVRLTSKWQFMLLNMGSKQSTLFDWAHTTQLDESQDIVIERVGGGVTEATQSEGEDT